jgi:hypothetical protein
MTLWPARRSSIPLVLWWKVRSAACTPMPYVADAVQSPANAAIRILGQTNSEPVCSQTQVNVSGRLQTHPYYSEQEVIPPHVPELESPGIVTRAEKDQKQEHFHPEDP